MYTRISSDHWMSAMTGTITSVPPWNETEREVVFSLVLRLNDIYIYIYRDAREPVSGERREVYKEKQVTHTHTHTHTRQKQGHIRFIIQRGHEHTRTGNWSESGFGSLRGALWTDKRHGRRHTHTNARTQNEQRRNDRVIVEVAVVAPKIVVVRHPEACGQIYIYIYIYIYIHTPHQSRSPLHDGGFGFWTTGALRLCLYTILVLPIWYGVWHTNRRSE